MNKTQFLYLGGLICAAFAALSFTGSAAPALARKTGGAPERLLEQQRHRGASQNQPAPAEQRLARKVGGAKTRLLWPQRHRLG